MSKEFYTQTLSTTYDFDDFYIACEKKVKLFFKDKVAVLIGFGESYQEKQDPDDEILGKGFALTRANKDIDNQIENWLIKYSCKPNGKMDNIFKDATLTLHLKDINEDGLRILRGEPQPTTLDKLVGKWAIRIKPCQCRYGSDGSYTSDPIFVRGFYETYVEYNGLMFTDNISTLSNEWLDSNWIEYKGERTNGIKIKGFSNERIKPDGRTYKQYALDLIDKGYTLVPLCSSNHKGMSIQHCSKCSTPGKTVIVKGWGLHDYKSTKEDVEMWFRNNPDINIGALYRDNQGGVTFREI